MSEKIKTGYKRILTYEGVYNIKETYELIKAYLDSRDYDIFDLKNESKDFGDGTKVIEIVHFADRDFTDMDLTRMYVVATFRKVGEIVVKGKKYDKGSVTIVLIGAIIYDDAGKWSKYSWQILVNLFVRLFIAHEHNKAINDFQKTEVDNLYDRLLTFFNAKER